MRTLSAVRRAAVTVCMFVSTLAALPAGASESANLLPVPTRATALEVPEGTAKEDLPTGFAWGDPTEAGGSSLGNGSFVIVTFPDLVQGGSELDGKEVSRIDPGLTSACGIARGQVFCWGNNAHGQLGSGTAGGFSLVPEPVDSTLIGSEVTAITVGGAHACALSNGEAFCWGENSAGQLGDGTNVPSHAPKAIYTSGVLAGKRVTAIAAGRSSTCAIADADVFCWGSNETAQLGDGTHVGSNRPVAVLHTAGWDVAPVDAVTVGEGHACAITAGTGFCWGSNKNGQLGVKSAQTEIGVPTPVWAVDGPLKGLTVRSIQAGQSQTCAIAGTSPARAFCWGEGSYGQIGDNDTKDRNQPTAVWADGALKGLNVSTVSVENRGGCVTAAGNGYCWGNAFGGRLGNNTSGNSVTPAPVAVSKAAMGKRRFLTVSAELEYTTSIAVTPRVFGDVKTGHDFYDDITWGAGSGITQGNTDGTFKPGSDIDRQSLAAFLYRYAHPGIRIPDCKAGDSPFTDVKDGNMFCGAIKWMADNDITPTQTGKFAPGGKATRAVIADWVYKTHHRGGTTLPCTNTLFDDVDGQTPHCGSIEWLASAGVTNGFPDGTYRPDEPVHRDAIMAFFHRLTALGAN